MLHDYLKLLQSEARESFYSTLESWNDSILDEESIYPIKATKRILKLTIQLKLTQILNDIELKSSWKL